VTVAIPNAAHAPAKDMAWIPGGEFAMGSNDFYPEEAPARIMPVDGFWIDEHPVTVAEFRRFVKDTGYTTMAERAPAAADYPDADPELLQAGSVVFTPPPGPVELNDVRNWWAYVPGAFWRRPEGPTSNVGGRERHPVVHVAYEDCLAYAAWARKSLPTEAEWERAARGGIEGAVFAWGDEERPRGRLMANTWQGEFPWKSTGVGGTSPVGSYPPNGFGLYDMTGNVWEWTTSPLEATAGCCGPEGDERFERRVIKGGSHLCAPNYCFRYRPAARQSETVDTSTSHIGFRCVVRIPE
jgi:formylglycine-generating enzyme required for sulfatase activity